MVADYDGHVTCYLMVMLCCRPSDGRLAQGGVCGLPEHHRGQVPAACDGELMARTLSAV